MRDDKTRLALQNAVERRLNEQLGLRVDGAGRLVQNDDARIFQNDARKGKKLFFACGQSLAALAKHGVVSVRKARGDAVAVDRLCCRDALLVRRLWRAVADVLQHRPFEDKRLLHEHADLLSQRMQRRPAHVHAVHLHAALVDVIKACEKADDRRLARARWSDQGDLLTGIDMQIEVFEDVDARLVAKGDVVEVHFALHVLQGDGVLGIVNGDGRIDGLVHALQIGGHLRELLQNCRKLQQRLGKDGGVQREGDDRARKRGRAAHDEGERDGVDREHHRIPEQFGDGRVQLVAPDDLHPGGGTVLLQAAVDFAVVVRAVVVLDDLLAHDGFDDKGVAVGVLGAVVPPQPPHRALDEIDAHGERNRRRVHDGCEQRADAEHENGRNDDLENIHDEVQKIVCKEVRKFVDIVGDADGDLARGTVVVVVEGQLLEL